MTGPAEPSSWKDVFEYVLPMDPDYPTGMRSAVVLFRDNLGGLVLWLRDSQQKVVCLPLPWAEALDLAAAINSEAQALGTQP